MDPVDPPASLREGQDQSEILSQHLHPHFTASLRDESPILSATQEPEVPEASSDAQEAPQSSLKLQGGDVHRDLYRLNAKSKQAKLDKRAASFSFVPREPDDSIDESVAALEPQSFRRYYVRQHHPRPFDHPAMTTSFLDFLDLYGNFAGEDLADTDDEESTLADSREAEEEREHPERRPLLGRKRSSRVARPGDASRVRTFFTLLKAFIGTGIIFLPKAFRNGGLLFSSVTLVTTSLITTLCFHLLLQCRRQYGGGYGELGERIGGPRLRSLILTSIAISQIGFVCACIIFTAENLHVFLEAVAGESMLVWSTGGLILFQLIILIPLSWIRNISKLGPVALIADVFILLGLGYIYYYDIAMLAARHGLEPSVKLFNSSGFTLTIGSCIFTFEGIGLILPVQSSMKRPDQFEWLLCLVMAIITVLFTAVGALSYATFGEHTQTEIFSNFPQTSRLVNTIQFVYAMAILVGTPIQLFPAARILEGKVFGPKSGKRDPSIKWKKNIFRTGMVLGCGLLSGVGAGDLDKFVSLIGSFACVPLVYIYPAYLHRIGVAESLWVRRGDLAMITLGLVFMVYTTTSTISVWIQGAP